MQELPQEIDLSDYCRFAFIKITYSGWIDNEYVQRSIIVVMN